jgi:hypothetical protein
LQQNPPYADSTLPAALALLLLLLLLQLLQVPPTY